MTSPATSASPDRCPDRPDLFAFNVGKLPDVRREAIAAHLHGCADCVAELDGHTDRADPVLADLRRPLPPGVLPTDLGGCTEPDAGSDTPSALGRLGQYDLLEKLGAGGMGEVYRARHRLMQRVAAVKVIHKRHLDQPEAVPRFHREIRNLAQLDHPNIVHADYADRDGDRHFLVMEYVEGRDLSRLVRERGPLPIVQACACIRQAALGLQHAHEHGLVHRDLKPSNLMVSMVSRAAARLTTDCVVKILDLGLARCRDETAGDLTPTGQVMGTFDYMAPEQADNSRDADIRADLYSLGCTLFFLLTGQPPFGGKDYDTPTKKLKAHALTPPPCVTDLRADIPAGVVAVLDRLLAKQPADRYDTPAALAAALEPFADTRALPALTAAPSTRAWVPSTETPPRPAPQPAPQPKRRRSIILAALRLPWWELRLVWVKRHSCMLMFASLLSVMLVVALGVLVLIPSVQKVRQKRDPLPLTEARYRGKLDILVERNGRLLRLHEDGALPLRKNDKFRIEGEVDPPAYVYVLWVDPGHDVTPVYPWDPKVGWGSRPKTETPLARVSLPPNAGNRYTAEQAAPGVATMVLFARPTPLDVPDDVVRGWFENLPELPLPPDGEHAAVWFDNYVEVADPDRSRTFQVVGADDPFARWQGRLQQALDGRAAFESAVSFARSGRK